MNATRLIRRLSTSSNALLRVRPRPSRLFQQQRAASSVLGSEEQRYSRMNGTWWMAVGAMGVGIYSSTASTVAACEEEKEAPPPADAKADKNEREETKAEEEDKDTIGPDDPYYTIPEEDEPTDCSMCLTFRQGPCRADWKRFELCVKDQDPPKDKDAKQQEETAPKDPTACMKYAMPFYLCSSNHVNSYLIIGNDQTQKTVIEPLMETYNAEEAQSRRLCYNGNAIPALDWVHWEVFVTKLFELGGSIPTKFALETTGFQSPVEALKATWADPDGNQFLMMDGEGEPYLLSVFAQIPKQVQSDDSDARLFMTFALDQHGNLLGDARNQEDDIEEEKKEQQKEEEPVTDVRLHVQVVPGVTERFTIYSLYVPKDGDFLTDGVLYESKPYTFEEVNKKAAKKANELVEQKSQEEKEKKEE